MSETHIKGGLELPIPTQSRRDYYSYNYAKERKAGTPEGSIRQGGGGGGDPEGGQMHLINLFSPIAVQLQVPSLPLHPLSWNLREFPAVNFDTWRDENFNQSN